MTGSRIEKYTEIALNILSDNSGVIFHILVTIHNLYLIIASRNHREEEEVGQDNDRNPIESVVKSVSDATAATATIISSSSSNGGGDEDRNADEDAPEKEEQEECTGHQLLSCSSSPCAVYPDSLSISISSYSSSGYSSAASPTIFLNGSLSDSSSSLSVVVGAGGAGEDEEVKSDHNYCGNENGETIPCLNEEEEEPASAKKKTSVSFSSSPIFLILPSSGTEAGPTEEEEFR